MANSDTLCHMANSDTLSHIHGSLLGLAVGDAIGTTVETMPSGSFEPLTDMIGGGKFMFCLDSGQTTLLWHFVWQKVS